MKYCRRANFAIVLLTALGAFEAVAQKPSLKPERNREIVALLNDARLAAPELTVDTFLKVVESKKVTDPVWRKEIVDEALRTIDDVQYPMPMHAAFGGDRDGTIRSLNDTEFASLIGAYSTKLDKLSFTGRVITLLLETDRERAKQVVFQMGGQLGLKPRTCEDVLSYVPDDIYPVVAKVAKAVFTDKRVADGQRALFVSPWIENIESPRQINPALSLLNEMQGSVAERQLLFNAASRAINRDFKDDRSFTQTWERIAARVEKITGGEADPLKSDLLVAFRGMALKNLRGKRCKDNEIKAQAPLPNYIVAINKLFPEKPLVIEDVIASDYNGTPKVTHIMQKSTLARRIGAEIVAVRDQKIVDNKIVNHDASDIQWATRVSAFVDQMLSMDGTDGETEGEMLFLKSAFVGAVLDGVNPGELRKSLVRKFLRLVANSRLQTSSFIEWRNWIASVERMASDSFDEIAAEFPNSNLKVILGTKRLLKEPEKEKNAVPEAPAKPASVPVKPDGRYPTHPLDNDAQRLPRRDVSPDQQAK